jgi:hypothetical protein
VIPGVTISVNKNAPPDNRSYRVDFALYESLAPSHQPQVDLLTAVSELQEGLSIMGFRDPNFRASRFMRLEVLKQLGARGPHRQGSALDSLPLPSGPEEGQ